MKSIIRVHSYTPFTITHDIIVTIINVLILTGDKAAFQKGPKRPRMALLILLIVCAPRTAKTQLMVDKMKDICWNEVLVYWLTPGEWWRDQWILFPWQQDRHEVYFQDWIWLWFEKYLIGIDAGLALTMVTQLSTLRIQSQIRSNKKADEENIWIFLWHLNFQMTVCFKLNIDFDRYGVQVFVFSPQD